MEVTQLRDLGVESSMQAITDRLQNHLEKLLETQGT